MKTLTTNISAGYQGGSTPVYLVRIKPASAYDTWSSPYDEGFFWSTADVTINADSGTDWLYNLNNTDYDETMIDKNGISSIVQSVDISKGGNIGEIGGVTIKILNQERFDRTLSDNNIQLENRLIKIGLIFSDKSNVNDTNILEIYRGIIKDIDYNYDQISLKIIDDSLKRHKYLPKTIITNEGYPASPKKSINEVIPILYGDISSYDNAFAFGVITARFLGDQKINIDDQIISSLTNIGVYDSNNELYYPADTDAYDFVVDGSGYSPIIRLTRATTSLLDESSGLSSDRPFINKKVSGSGTALSLSGSAHSAQLDNEQILFYKKWYGNNTKLWTERSYFNTDSASHVDETIFRQAAEQSYKNLIKFTVLFIPESLKYFDINDQSAGTGAEDAYCIQTFNGCPSPVDRYNLSDLHDMGTSSTELRDSNIDFINDYGVQVGDYLILHEDGCYTKITDITSSAFGTNDVLHHGTRYWDDMANIESVKYTVIRANDEDNNFATLFGSNAMDASGVAKITQQTYHFAGVSPASNTPYIFRYIISPKYIKPSFSNSTLIRAAVLIQTRYMYMIWAHDDFDTTSGLTYYEKGYVLNGTDADTADKIKYISDERTYNITTPEPPAGESGRSHEFDNASSDSYYYTTFAECNATQDGTGWIDLTKSTGGESPSSYGFGYSTLDDFFDNDWSYYYELRLDLHENILLNFDHGFTLKRNGLHAEFYLDFNQTNIYSKANGRIDSGGSLIENPQDIITNIYNTELGVASALISDGTTSRSSWNMARSIFEQENSADIIKSLCRDSACINFVRYNSQERIVDIEEKESADMTIDNSNIIIKNKNTTFKIDKTPLDELYTDFFIKYRKNYETGKYVTNKYVNTSSNNFDSEGSDYQTICSNAESKYNIDNNKQFIYEADWIFEEATAEKLCKWFVNWFTERKLLVEFEMMLDGIALEIGDQIKIDHALLPSNINNESKFIIYKIRHNPNSDIIKIYAREL